MGTSKQWLPPVITTTVVPYSFRRGAASHGEHQGSDTACHHYDSKPYTEASRFRWADGDAWIVPSQRVQPVTTTTEGIAPPGGRQLMKGMETVSTSCHHYDNGSCTEASRRRLGGSAWRKH